MNNTGKRCRLWHHQIIFSDEARFNIGWYVNKQTCRIWDTENTHTYIDKLTHPKRVAVCCRFWSRGITGPFFFENEQGQAITVNGDRYRAMLNEFLFTKLKRRKLAMFGFNRTTLRATQPKLHSMTCARFLKIALLAAELMSLDYYLWNAVKDKCNADKPETL